MRLLFTILALLTVSKTASTQVYFPLHVGDSWYYEDRTSLLCEGTSLILPLMADSLIGGHVYARFPGNTPFSGPFLRADSSRVYEFDTSSHTEYVVFDFLAKPGDTVSIRDGGARVTIALGGLEFVTGHTTFTIRDSLGLIAWFDSYTGCSFDLISAWIDGKQVYLSAPRTGTNVPPDPSLEQNYPNPFNPATTIGFYLPVAQTISLRIYNGLGQEVAVLFEGRMPGGSHQIVWRAGNNSSGVYFCALRTERATLTRKLVSLR